MISELLSEPLFQHVPHSSALLKGLIRSCAALRAVANEGKTEQRYSKLSSPFHPKTVVLNSLIAFDAILRSRSIHASAIHQRVPSIDCLLTICRPLQHVWMRTKMTMLLREMRTPRTAQDLTNLPNPHHFPPSQKNWLILAYTDTMRKRWLYFNGPHNSLCDLKLPSPLA